MKDIVQAMDVRALLMACHLRVRRLRLLQIDSNEKAGAAVRGYGGSCFALKISVKPKFLHCR